MEYFVAIKAVGDWELDVLAIPFHSVDSDGQWFDENTEVMSESFTTPIVMYQHGVKQGAEGIDERPVEVGKSVPGSLEKKLDGWHIRVILNKALKVAKDIMEAAKSLKVAVSSDSIGHLARLEVNGKLIQYEKNRAGRIAVWPFAGVSLWENGGGNFRPANPRAIAMPAMKAIYRDAGLQFPDIDTTGDDEAEMVKHRTEVAKAKMKALQILGEI